MTGRKPRSLSISAFVAVAGLSAACVQILGIDSTTVADNSDDASPNYTSTTDVITNNDAWRSTVDARTVQLCRTSARPNGNAGDDHTHRRHHGFFSPKANAPGMQVFVCPQSSDVGCFGRDRALHERRRRSCIGTNRRRIRRF